MTLTELAQEVARVTGFDGEEAWVICEALFEALARQLEREEEVKIRNFGTFKWVTHQERDRRVPVTGALVTVPSQRVLKFTPSGRFTPREARAMEKLGVQYDEEKVKEAEKGEKNPNACPRCGKDAGEERNCPEHGTEPFETKESE